MACKISCSPNGIIRMFAILCCQARIIGKLHSKNARLPVDKRVFLVGTRVLRTNQRKAIISYPSCLEDNR